MEDDSQNNSADGDTTACDGQQENAEACETAPKLSKNKLRKMKKLEMKLKFRPERRKLERARKKEKRKQAYEAGEVLPPTRKHLRKEPKQPVDINIVVDCSFEEFMSENDIKKLVKQLQHCYAINRRAEQPFKYHVTSYSGQTRDIIDNLAGTHSWDVKWAAQSYHEVFSNKDIVYLSAESDNVIESLEVGKAYIIGGLVDHNREKGMCHRLAVEKGVSHAQLPISQYIDLKCRKVLTIDHVFEILQKYHELKDWKAAFFAVIPKRKGAQEKEDITPNTESKVADDTPSNQPDMTSEPSATDNEQSQHQKQSQVDTKSGLENDDTDKDNNKINDPAPNTGEVG